MGHLVRIVVPDNFKPNLRLRGVVERITQRWGGCTCYSADGYWGCGEIIRDDVVVCECSVGEYVAQWWHELAKEIAREFDQECVYLSVREETAMLVDQGGVVKYIGQG